MKCPFEVGDLVYYDEVKLLTSILYCSQYIVVCTHEWPDEGTLHGIKQVNVLVYPQDWHLINLVLPLMSKSSKKVQFSVLNQDIIVELRPKRKGVYWQYKTVPQSYGLFRTEDQAINDAKLYSQYGTTSKDLLKAGAASSARVN